MRKKILEQQMTCDGWFTASHARVCRLHLAACDHLTGQIAELDHAEAVAPFRRAAATAPGLVKARPGARPRALLKLMGGIDQRRELPQFASERFTSSWARRATETGGERVILWPDTFTNNFHPAVGRAAVAVLEDAGFAVEVPGSRLCCGLTWISTGQLSRARGCSTARSRHSARRCRQGGMSWSSSQAARRSSGPMPPSCLAATTPGCWPGRPGRWPRC
jgi:hypothetical protein